MTKLNTVKEIKNVDFINCPGNRPMTLLRKLNCISLDETITPELREAAGEKMDEIFSTETRARFTSKGLKRSKESERLYSPTSDRTNLHIMKKGRSDWSDRRRHEAWDSIELY